MCWPEAVGSFFGFACVARLNWRAGIEGTKPVRTLDPRSPLSGGMQTSPCID